MATYNRVILMGNLTRDIQLRYTPTGTPVTEVGMAVNDRRKGTNGEWIDEVTFVEVTFWGRTAEIAAEYLSKGSPVFVEGRLKYDSWEKDGQKHSKLRVVCERMQMLSSREGGQRSSAAPATAAAATTVHQPHDEYIGESRGFGGDSRGHSVESDSGGFNNDEIPF